MVKRTLAHSHARTLALVLAASSALIGACGARTPAEAPGSSFVTDSVIWDGDIDLAPVLRRPQLGGVEMAAAERVEIRVGPMEFVERLGVIVEDTSAPWLVRLNAIKLLADRGATSELPVFASALRSRDERVRIAAVAAMREFMTLRPKVAVEIIAYALKDPSFRVQTAALQTLGDRDVEVLRSFLPRAQHADVRKITLDLIRAAEERGAPLVENDATGTLERTNASGITITFKPTTRWPQWDAAAGDLLVALPKQKAVLVASNVEVVGKVIPAFVSSDGKTLVYEVNREVRTRNLETSADQKLADGIAPRILPFTEDVIYFTEIRARRMETPNTFVLKYEVMKIPLAGGSATSIGQVGTTALNELKGNYSPVRWSRILELEGNFTLVGEQLPAFDLPSPFASE